MNTKLIYLYIKDINRGFHNVDFNFTDDFIVRYDLDTRNIHIEKKEAKNFKLWGNRINSIDLIVGKNGAGKSTALDLIAETKMNRRHLFNKYGEGMKGFLENKFSEWFAIYHVEKDIFVVEGGEPNLLFQRRMTTSHEYSFICKYDFAKRELKFDRYIQGEMIEVTKSYGKTLDKTVVFMYGDDLKQLSWMKNKEREYISDNYVGFQRTRIPTANTSNVYHFLSKEYEMLEKEKFTAQNVFCIIDKESFYKNVDIPRKSLDQIRLLYQGETSITEKLSNNVFQLLGIKEEYVPFTKKENFIITLLESYIMNAWINGINKDVVDQKEVNDVKELITSIEFNGLPEEKSFEHLLKYLSLVLHQICEALSKKYLDGEKTYYAQALIDFIKCIQFIKDEYFISYNTIKIPVDGSLDKEVERVLTVYDSYFPRDEEKKNDLQMVIDVHYSNMSKGEMIFVNHFSSLYQALALSLNQNVKNVILCLDEPEGSFHPEWARKYIYYLTKFLNGVKKEKVIKYQVIISTHSPFIVSDIPGNNITCIKLLENDGVYSRITEKANFGFGSNLYDIIKNDFFLDSSIGEFATKEINKILRKINKLSKYNEQTIKKIQSFINIIDDKFIQNKLDAILKQRIREIMSEDEKSARIRELEEELSRLKERKK
ncbi:MULTISPECIES: AAA family ATPase [Bacillus]|uniref:AAA family ATPase n=1 Tax=Bacillus TaxID=1386 RepID=UPI0008E8FA1D|nr:MULTISPECIES: AAA family ATPase [Bacillus]MDZ4496016.1 AAA family ATPase [Bacillus cereus]PGL23480.1 hypothetical protein CN917_02900 [Bacillus thuringiensis]SFK67046.1 AAA domain-containing protein, putative AbiEii toxin, Type IV TA system [Bacillus sp. 5mfcol3.1]